MLNGYLQTINFHIYADFLEKVNQSKNIGGNCLLIDLPMERIFTYVILLPKFNIPVIEKVSLKLVSAILYHIFIFQQMIALQKL